MSNATLNPLKCTKVIFVGAFFVPNQNCLVLCNQQVFMIKFVAASILFLKMLLTITKEDFVIFQNLLAKMYSQNLKKMYSKNLKTKCIRKI